MSTTTSFILSCALLGALSPLPPNTPTTPQSQTTEVPIIKFGYTIYYVQDVPATLAFYNKALGLETKFIHESNQYGELATGDVVLAFADEKMAAAKGIDIQHNRSGNETSGVGVTFLTPNAEEVYNNALAAGAEVVTPFTKSDEFGAESGWLRDPNGIQVGIYEVNENTDPIESITAPITKLEFSDTMIIVPDVQEALDFYKKAFGFDTIQIYQDGEVGELSTGEVSITFSSEKFMTNKGLPFNPIRPDKAAPGGEIALTTTDVAGAYAHALSVGCAAASEPKEQPWGQTVAWVRDCNGVIIELCTPMN